MIANSQFVWVYNILTLSPKGSPLHCEHTGHLIKKKVFSNDIYKAVHKVVEM